MSLSSDTSSTAEIPAVSATAETAQNTVVAVLLALSFSHLLNDTMQSVLPAIYPLLKPAFGLTFSQIGLITLANPFTASLLQPVVGFYTDRQPKPYAMPVGMGFTLVGMVLLATANSFAWVLLAAALVGLGSSVFHPEASRVTHMAAGGRHGFAQSLFQVGGNAGTSLGPLLAALLLVPGERVRVLWFSLVALLGIVVLTGVGRWFRRNVHRLKKPARRHLAEVHLSPGRVGWSIAVLVLLVFSKFFHIACMTSYYTFYLIQKFGLSVPHAQLFLFLFLFAVAIGTICGGQLGDRFGRRRVIWLSILGAAPFSLCLPYASLGVAAVLTVCVGVILASAFPAMVVYAQELVPGKVGMMAGLFFGLAFGMGALGSALLGFLADKTSLNFVFHLCAFLPLLGLLAAALPELEKRVPEPAAG